MTIEHAYQRSLETVMQWLHNEVNMSKTKVYFRTFAPVHFRFVSVLFICILVLKNRTFEVKNRPWTSQCNFVWLLQRRGLENWGKLPPWDVAGAGNNISAIRNLGTSRNSKGCVITSLEHVPQNKIWHIKHHSNDSTKERRACVALLFRSQGKPGSNSSARLQSLVLTRSARHMERATLFRVPQAIY